MRYDITMSAVCTAKVYQPSKDGAP